MKSLIATLVPKWALPTIALIVWSSLATADVTVIDDVAKAYFPEGSYETVIDTHQIKSYAHTDEKDMVFFTLTVFKDHGQPLSSEWFSHFVEGQEATISNAVSGVNQV